MESLWAVYVLIRGIHGVCKWVLVRFAFPMIPASSCRKSRFVIVHAYINRADNNHKNLSESYFFAGMLNTLKAIVL